MTTNTDSNEITEEAEELHLLLTAARAAGIALTDKEAERLSEIRRLILEFNTAYNNNA